MSLKEKPVFQAATTAKASLAFSGHPADDSAEIQNLVGELIHQQGKTGEGCRHRVGEPGPFS